MRRLIYVPIIHTGPDLGTLAGGIEARAQSVVSSGNWQKHTEVVRLYWQAIASYWEGETVSGFKVFQDGMPVDGVVGKNIVKDLADQGSINHKIIEQLLEKGARLCKTESSELLKQEYRLTSALIERKSFLGSLLALVRYRWRKEALLKARDTFIVNSINEQLEDGETGICFLGASHSILPHLPGDIEVIALKDPEKVRAYSQKFTSKKWMGRGKRLSSAVAIAMQEELDRLGSYLATPISIQPGEIHE